MRARTWLLVAVLAGALVVAGAGVGTAQQGRSPDEPWSDPTLQRGGALFQAHCAACHGTAGIGRPGAGVTAGPPVDDVPVPYVDLVLRTGRMPIPAPEAGVLAERLGDEERRALVAWMQARFDLPGHIPAPAPGDAGRGLEPFVRHCASCHGAGGGGGVAGGGTVVPAIRGADPVTVVEATRVGPFAMPAFSEEVIDDDDVEDIAAYLRAADEAPGTLLGLRTVDQIGAATAGAVLVAAAVLVLLLVNRPGRRGRP